MVKVIAKTLLVAASLVVLGAGAADADRKDKGPVRIIETYGQASGVVEPSRVSIVLHVEERSEADFPDAYNGLTRRLEQIRVSLESNGVDVPKEVTTHDLRLFRHDKHIRNRAVPLVEHVASVAMVIERPLDPGDAEAISRFLRQTLEAGATGFGGLTFHVDAGEREAMQARLEELAVADARKRADALAKAAGARVGAPLRIVIGPGSRMSMGPPPATSVSRDSMMMKSAGAEHANMRIHAGRGATISVGIQATFRLKGAKQKKKE